MAYYRDTKEQREYKKRWQVETEAGREYTARKRARTAAWFTKRKEENREFIAKRLAKHRCVDCGEADVAKLEWDHRDPETKRFNISGGGRVHGKFQASGLHRSRKDLIDEMCKCDVRCVECHKKRTRKLWRSGVIRKRGDTRPRVRVKI